MHCAENCYNSSTEVTWSTRWRIPSFICHSLSNTDSSNAPRLGADDVATRSMLSFNGSFQQILRHLCHMEPIYCHHTTTLCLFHKSLHRQACTLSKQAALATALLSCRFSTMQHHQNSLSITSSTSLSIPRHQHRSTQQNPPVLSCHIPYHHLQQPHRFVEAEPTSPA